MMEEAVYNLEVQQHERFAAAANGDAVIAWEIEKANWLRDADRARSLKIPPPEKPVPAWKKTVIAAPYLPGPYEIKTLSGPERVADGTLVLPEVPSFLVEAFPAGVQAIGNRTSDGGYWVALPEDTMPHGWTGVHAGRKIEKNEDRGFGGLRRSFYFDRGAA
jgi:hypothetical protein